MYCIVSIDRSAKRTTIILEIFKHLELTYIVPEMTNMTIERAIRAMIMEKIDSSAALYSALVTVN